MSRKSKVRIIIEKGALSLHNKQGNVTKEYHIRSPTMERRGVLDSIIRQKKGGAYGIHKALVARRTLGKNRLSEDQKTRITSDINYIKRKYYDTDKWNLIKNKTASPYKSTRKVRKSNSHPKSIPQVKVTYVQCDSDSGSDSDSDDEWF